MDKASIICPQCGKAFAPKRKNSRFCCVQCYRKHYQINDRRELRQNVKRRLERHPRPSRRKALRELECPHCGKAFRQTHPWQKYCCTRCAVGASRNRLRDKLNKLARARYRLKHPKGERRLCLFCGAEFVPAHVDSICCSRSCSRRLYNSKHRDKINESARTYYRLKHPKEEKRLCSFCGAEFVPIRTDSTCCSRSCSRRLYWSKHKEQLRIRYASYNKSPGARILREMRLVAYNEILESDPEAYAEFRRKCREKSRKRAYRTRCRPYKPRLSSRFPDYVCKGQDMIGVYSQKFCEPSFEGNAFARELAIERGRQTGRF